MATTQLDCSIGMSIAESTYGTAVTATKFFEFTDESLGREPTFLQGQGLRVGSRIPRAARRTLGREMASGDFTVEACSKGLGALLMAAFGAVTSTQRATTGVYQHNFTPVAGDYLPSYTLQKGIPPLGGGAATAYTFPGSVCSAVTIACPNADLVTVQTTWNAREVQTGVAYAAPSYPTPMELFSFAKGAITIGGSPTAPTTTALATGGTAVADIRDFTVTWDNGLDDGGFNLGSSGKRARKPATGVSALTGNVTAEYDATTLRDAYVNQTDLALVLTFTGSTVIGTGSDNPGLQIYIPDIRLEGEIPKAAGGDVITQSIDFTGLDNLSATPITVSYVSTDTAP